MKQKQIYDLYSAVSELSAYRLPVRTSYQVFSISKKIEDAYTFGVEQSRKIVDKHNGKIEGNGNITFDNPEALQAFKADTEELDNLDIDIDIEPIEISFDDFGDQTISPSVIKGLDGFVNFK